MLRLFLLKPILFLLLLSFGNLSTVQSSIAQELWVYIQTNLMVPQEIERIEELMQKAKDSGYTHLLLADSKFSRLSELNRRYFQHVERIKTRADELNLKLILAVCPVGYSNGMLSLNPNLAEGLPVREALYEVQSGLAIHQAESNVSLPSLSEIRKWSFIDESLQLNDQALRSVAPHSQNVRIAKKLKLQPFRHYHIAVDIKTQDFDTPVEIKVLAPDGQSLSYTNLGVLPTQDWKTHHITFNSLAHSDATLYIGSWGPQRGSLSLRTPILEECGAVNLIRRETAPIKVEVQSQDGKRIALKETIDFEAWTDPQLGVVPYPGEYDVWHQAPPIKLIKPLADGTKLRVSYYHTHIVYDHQVCGTAGDSEFQKLLDNQIEQMTKLFPNGDFMMSHDEYRVMGWTDSNLDGISPKASPAQVLTHNVRHCNQMLQKHAPTSSVAVWSDMFDPHHNARDRYYLVNGSLIDSNAPTGVRIVNWNFDNRHESLKHFSNRGHTQILAGYYDSNPEQITKWLDTVVDNKIPGVQGVMYTTWRKNFSDLEEFARLVQSHPWYSASN